ncbi:MAG: trypsin-like serine protease [Myxococcales bacterium]|jgi:hypothetical protein|nr:trypsin-like serine protease [Myxococcales bacterium]
MQNRSPALLALALGISLHAAGCAEPEDQADPVSDPQSLSNSALAPDATYAVYLQVPAGTCTGIVLSKHYILTAGHCLESNREVDLTVRGGTQGEVTLYQGRANVGVHPSYREDDAHWMYDAGLILLHGNGMSSVPEVRFYAGPEAPWTQSGGLFQGVGYGRGTAPGDAENCMDNARFGARRRGNFRFLGRGEVVGGVWRAFDAQSSVRSLCPGDSGGPLVLNRGGRPYVFGVTSRSYLRAGAPVTGILAEPLFPDIELGSRQAGRPLSCPVRSEGGVSFRVCSE